MSWMMALTIASTALSAVQQYKSQKAQAAFGQAQADIQKQQYDADAAIAKLRGAQEEVERKREFEFLSADNNNNTDYDPHSSNSWLALRGDNEEQLNKDLGNIKLNSLGTQRKLQLSAHSASVSGAAFRRSGKGAIIGLAANLAKGGAQAYSLSGPSGGGFDADYASRGHVIAPGGPR